MIALAHAIEEGAANAPSIISLSGISLQIALAAISENLPHHNWADDPDEDTADNALATALDELMTPVDPNPIGTILMWGGDNTTVPSGWLICNGAYQLRSDYPELFAIVGSLYGSTATTFALPNFTQKFPLGYQGYGAYGLTGGQASVTLGSGNLPAHTHSITSSANITLYKFSGSGAGRNGLGVTAGLNASSVRLQVDDNTTANAAFSIIPPYQMTLFIIKAA